MAAICLLTLAGGSAAHDGLAATGCPALDYQRSLSVASQLLQRQPPDTSGARTLVTQLLRAEGSRRRALQPVLEALDGTAGVAVARIRLEALAGALAYPRGATCREDSAPALAALHEVYASPAFRHLDDGGNGNGWQRIAASLAAIVGRGAAALGPVAALVLLGAALLLSGLLAGRPRRRGLALATPPDGEPGAPGDDPDVEWGRAERAAARGQHREAVRRAFRSALLAVAAHSQVRLDAAWTTREVLDRVSPDGEVLAALTGAAAVFERTWYSGAPVVEQDWEVAAERCRRVRALAGRARGVHR